MLGKTKIARTSDVTGDFSSPQHITDGSAVGLFEDAPGTIAHRHERPGSNPSADYRSAAPIRSRARSSIEANGPTAKFILADSTPA
jgi:hypothetical protein